MRDLDDRLRGVLKSHGGRMEELRRRRRLAYIDEAEEWSLEHSGRRLTENELAGVIRRFTG